MVYYRSLRQSPRDNRSKPRLAKYVDLCERIADLEREFGCECLEVEFERDAISDTFQEVTDFGVLFTCSLAYGLFQGQVDEITKIYLNDLPDHLKLRLLRTHVESEFGFEKIDPTEFDPKFQNAFYEVEKRNIGDFEKTRVLEQKFGVIGWRSRRDLNPGVIYEIPTPDHSIKS